MANTGDPLGVGIACSTGFPLAMRLCWGEENLQNSLLRRLHAGQGCLAFIGDDPTYGRDVANLLNRSWSETGEMAAEGGAIAAELRKDPRVQDARARIVASQDSLTIYIDGESAEGPFSLVVPVGSLTVAKFNQGLAAPSPTETL